MMIFQILQFFSNSIIDFYLKHSNETFFNLTFELFSFNFWKKFEFFLSIWPLIPKYLSIRSVKGHFPALAKTAATMAADSGLIAVLHNWKYRSSVFSRLRIKINNLCQKTILTQILSIFDQKNVLNISYLR